MALPPSRDHRIPLTEAAAHLKRHRDGAPAAPRGQMFHGKPVQDLLAQPGCMGLRIYHGRNTDGSPVMVLVGVNANGDDMTQGTVLEFSYPCPPFCPASNELAP